jgi:hypothetical protein
MSINEKLKNKFLSLDINKMQNFKNIKGIHKKLLNDIEAYVKAYESIDFGVMKPSRANFNRILKVKEKEMKIKQKEEDKKMKKESSKKLIEDLKSEAKKLNIKIVLELIRYDAINWDALKLMFKIICIKRFRLLFKELLPELQQIDIK